MVYRLHWATISIFYMEALGRISKGATSIMARILVIDDENVQLMLRSALLEGKGHEVVALQDGVDAEALFLERSFDLVITDWLMPSINGIDLALRFKSINPSVPIILLTGLNILLDDNEATDRNIDLILAKPCDAEILIEAIDGILKKNKNMEKIGCC
jgi:CheY-like chemotaxis protein